MLMNIAPLQKTTPWTLPTIPELPRLVQPPRNNSSNHCGHGPWGHFHLRGIQWSKKRISVVLDVVVYLKVFKSMQVSRRSWAWRMKLMKLCVCNILIKGEEWGRFSTDKTRNQIPKLIIPPSIVVLPFAELVNMLLAAHTAPHSSFFHIQVVQEIVLTCRWRPFMRILSLET